MSQITTINPDPFSSTLVTGTATPTQDAYGGQGDLPLTGADVAGPAMVGIALVITGVAIAARIRRAV